MPKNLAKYKQELQTRECLVQAIYQYIFNESNLDKQSINVERFNQVENLITDNKKEKAPIQNKNKKLEI